MHDCLEIDLTLRIISSENIAFVYQHESASRSVNKPSCWQSVKNCALFHSLGTYLLASDQAAS